MTQELVSAQASEVVEMVDFVVAFGNALDQSLEDNKLGVTDLVNFYPAFTKAGPAFKGFNFKDLAHLDAEVKAEVLSRVGATLVLDSERTEAIVVEALATAFQLDKLVKAIKR